MKTTVPNLFGLREADALTVISAASLAVGTVSRTASPTVPAGHVMGQIPAGKSAVPFGASVTLLVSTGPEPEKEGAEAVPAKGGHLRSCRCQSCRGTVRQPRAR